MPFWVQWGDAVWQVAFVVSVALVAIWQWSGPRRRIRRETKNWIAPPTPVERFEEGANTIVEGILEGERDSVLVDGATVASIHGLSDSAVDNVPLAITVGDEVIELQGPVELFLGSEEIRPRGTFRRDGALHAKVCALPDGPVAAGHLEGQRYVIRWLHAGDRVQARGVLRRSAAQGEAGYRETQGRWVMRGTDQKPVALGSALPPRMKQKDVDRLAIGALLGGLAFAGVFVGLAALVHNSIPMTRSALRDSEDLIVALAATPLHREHALDALRTIWDQPDEASLERLALLVETRDGCHAPVALWQQHGNMDRATEAARECDHPAAHLALARGLYARGDMAEASRELQRIRDDLPLEYSPIGTLEISREAHALGATRAHLARARWRTAASELDAIYTPDSACVAAAAHRRGGVTTSNGTLDLRQPRGEPCLILEASEEDGDPAILEMLQHSSVAHLLMREANPGQTVFRTRERSHVAGESLGLSELELGIPTDGTCPIDARSAPGLERSVLDKLLAIHTQDHRTLQLISVLAARRALIEAVDGHPSVATHYMAMAQRSGRVGDQLRISTMLDLWNGRRDRPDLPDDMAMAAWDDPAHDRSELLRFRASTPAGRMLIRHGNDRPILGTFREHFCDAAARALAAERADMPDVAREHRTIAHQFRLLMEGRRAAILLWVLDRRGD